MTGDLPSFLSHKLKKESIPSFKGRQFARIGSKRSIAGMTTETLAAQKTFQQMLDLMKRGQEFHMVITKQGNRDYDRVLDAYWPLFASMPVPVVPSFPLFLTRSAEDCGNDWKPEFCWEGFCADWALFDMMFANRTMDRDAPQKKLDKEWYLVEAVQTIPQSLRHVPISGPLSGQNSFLSERQCICSVLGSHYFEHEYSQGLTSKAFDGIHQVELIPDQVARCEMWTVLLNFRPAVTQEEAESGGAALGAAEGLAPELKEPVEMEVTLVEQNGSETWTGIVVSGEQYAGSNCVLSMKLPQTPGGYVMESRVLRAHFRFGHIGTLVDKLRRSVLQLMETDSEVEDESKLGFWKRLVLAQDLSDSWLEENNRLSVNGHMMTRIRAVCTKRLLNSDQSAAVFHFSQHRVTIVIGPPGTGKSTLVAAINELLEEFRMAYWVCSESNAAVDVLAEKLAKEKKDKQAEGYLRVWPAFSEGYKCD